MSAPELTEVLLDTDVLSILFNRDPVRVPRYDSHLEGRVLIASFVSVAEMRFGARLRAWGPARCARLDEFLGEFSIVESTPQIGAMWAQIRAEAQHSGRTIERQDAWIAAVAVTLGLPLVTHNAAHFRRVPLLQLITEPDR